MSMKNVYLFDQGSAEMKNLLGGKGANLSEMMKLGLSIPPGFTITTRMCMEYLSTHRIPSGLMDEIKESVSAIEKITKKKFGDNGNPLLVSVRSGAPVSMPGMMDTVLNLGLNDRSVEGFATLTGDERFALDSYRRFIQTFGEVVLGVEHVNYQNALEDIKKETKAKYDYELKPAALRKLIATYKDITKREMGEDFPQEPWGQLRASIFAVFNSWNNRRAMIYRKIHKIPNNIGTAVNVQAMVFGNMGKDSGTGVIFSRNPSTGENKLFGEYLQNAQGEDVVAGTRTPLPLSRLEKSMPANYQRIEKISTKLENHYRDMQDIEFTIENGKLWILQTRSGKRTANAAVQIAVEMALSGLISKREALLRVDVEWIDSLLHRHIDPSEKCDEIAEGLPASPGAACGGIVFTADDAAEKGKSQDVVLVSVETTPEDIHGMIASKGIFTSRGGMTSHAAVVARGMGIPCVAGCSKAIIDINGKKLEVGGHVFHEGDTITIDGSTGKVMKGVVKTVEPELTSEFKTLLKWADNVSALKVRANADTPEAARGAREFGAKGIGLCRTERMFNTKDRLPIVREMILAKNEKERKDALDKLLPIQRNDFIQILKAMEGLPVNVRLLDPPLHEFLPTSEELIAEIAEMDAKGIGGKRIAEKEQLLDKVRKLREVNPMLGHRGCRLGITYPEIYEMQTRALIEAACQLTREGNMPKLEIMIPLVGGRRELEIMREVVNNTAKEVLSRKKMRVSYDIGTMIEIPRAALTADKIARYADFFSFGTNDLTQTTLGFSRDDAESKFLSLYLERGILEANPFQELDVEGVGKLIDIAVALGKRGNKRIKFGVCGETGGDPNSIMFYHKHGLDYVSCSIFRVPVARLACAQAALKHKLDSKKK
ncbi:MAG: pyruvate, phosphate dikinase [Candidatus Micrarchaeota archaeon]